LVVYKRSSGDRARKEEEDVLKVDPITLQVLTSAAYSIAEEMSIALVRTSRSTNIKDRRDASCALYDTCGAIAVISQSEIGTPLHLGVMGAAVGTALNKIPTSALEPGDDIIMNSPYPAGPGHLNDICVVSPIFYKDELVGLVANQAHHVDVGGYAPGSMPFGVTEIYQEGLQIPPLKLSRRGELNSDVVDLIMQNVRDPRDLKGDLMAQIAANNVGERRVVELMDRYGKATVQRYMQEIMNYSEQRMLAALRKLPAGKYAFEDYLEGDGWTEDLIKIKATIEITRDKFEVDFTGTSRQVQGPLNCRPASAAACVYYVLKAVLDPDLPGNAGAFRPVKVITETGSLVEVQYPGALANANIVTTMRIVDTLLGALKDVIPQRVVAGCQSNQLFNIGGLNPRTGQKYSYIETYGGGQGGLFDRDGMSGVQMHMTNTRNAPIEVFEASHPMFVERYGLIPDSAGAGKFRGGFGKRRDIRVLSTENTATMSTDRARIPPWGVFGGAPGACSAFLLRDAKGKTVKLPSKGTRRIDQGSVISCITAGGGGYGDPLERDPERVRFDVLEGLVSRQNSRKLYGVVLNASLKVDLPRTTELRRSMRSKRKPVSTRAGRKKSKTDGLA
jgi:N-methylhydantoinase B